MKTNEEAFQITDMCQRLEHSVNAAYNRMGKEVITGITYNNETEVITVRVEAALEHSDFEPVMYRVNVNMDSVRASICELVRELIVHTAQEFTGE